MLCVHTVESRWLTPHAAQNWRVDCVHRVRTSKHGRFFVRKHGRQAMHPQSTTLSGAGQAPSPRKTRRIDQEPESNPSRLGYAFVPVPRVAYNRRKEGLLKNEDLFVLGELIEFRGDDSASCWMTPETLAKRLGLSLSTVKRSLRRLRKAGLLRRDSVSKPDPEDPRNMTGNRLRFLWMNESNVALTVFPGVTSEPAGVSRVTQRVRFDLETGSDLTPSAGSDLTPNLREHLNERESTTPNAPTREESSSIEIPTADVEPKASPMHDGGDSLRFQEKESIPSEAMVLIRSKLGDTVADDIQACTKKIASDVKGNWSILSAAVTATAEAKKVGGVKNPTGLLRTKVREFAQSPDKIPSRLLPKPAPPPAPPAVDPFEKLGDLASPTLSENPEFEALIRERVRSRYISHGRLFIADQELFSGQAYAEIDASKDYRGYHPHTVAVMKTWATEEIFPEPFLTVKELMEGFRDARDNPEAQRALFDQEGNPDKFVAKLLLGHLSRARRAYEPSLATMLASKITSKISKHVDGILKCDTQDRSKLERHIASLLEQDTEAPVVPDAPTAQSDPVVEPTETESTDHHPRLFGNPGYGQVEEPASAGDLVRDAMARWQARETGPPPQPSHSIDPTRDLTRLETRALNAIRRLGRDVPTDVSEYACEMLCQQLTPRDRRGISYEHLYRRAVDDVTMGRRTAAELEDAFLRAIQQTARHAGRAFTQNWNRDQSKLACSV